MDTDSCSQLYYLVLGALLGWPLGQGILWACAIARDITRVKK